MTHKDLRKKFIDFFKSNPRNHKEIPSASLVPENDPTTLFTSSGMQPLINYLLGTSHPLGTRLVNSQKCFRAADIEKVGDNRHTTFFEMLGNWSLGDYFKREQLAWFFGFLTKELGLDPKKLYVTVFEGNKSVPKDTESITIWKEIFSGAGIDAKEGERIFTYPAVKNWWSRSGEPENMPPGEPGGPDSEVFFEFTQAPHNQQFGPKCHLNCDCGRFLEIGNSVFMQYQKQKNGSLKELPKKNVDFGGGLERLLTAIHNEPDIFKTELYKPIIQQIEKECNKSYEDEDNKRAMRVIADHIKAATFLIADGVEPSNKTQGYVLRRLLRRAAVKMYTLKGKYRELKSLSIICHEVIKMYHDVYFEGDKIKQKVTGIIENEMDKFSISLDKGLKMLESVKTPDAKTVFDLYQSYGFPVEITTEILHEKGAAFDQKQYAEELVKHKEVSKTSAKGIFRGGLQDQSEETTKLHTANHLLQQALRDVLGIHVRQRGSHITKDRLRFDFSHSQKLNEGQIKKVEEIVNQRIKENLSVSFKIMPFTQALSEGALTVPEAKYADMVKVYTIGAYAKEVCGGPHVDFTGRLGGFKIIKEEAAGANIRRVYAILEY